MIVLMENVFPKVQHLWAAPHVHHLYAHNITHKEYDHKYVVKYVVKWSSGQVSARAQHNPQGLES